MMRAALLSLVLLLLLPVGARAQSFAQLSGPAGCVLQTGLDFADDDEEADVYVEYAPKDCGRAGGLMNARSVVVSADQASVYVVSSGGALTGSNGVTTFSRGPDGALTFRGCVTATGGDGRVGSDGLCTRADSLRGATSLALSPDGKSAYVAAPGSNGVSWFSRDPATGALTAGGCIKHTLAIGERCVTGYALDGVESVAVSPDGKFVYAASSRSGAVVVFKRDATSGALTEASCVSDTTSDGACADGTALAGADGVLVTPEDVYVTSSAAGSVTGYRRDATTGALTPHGCLLAKAPDGGPCTSVPALEGADAGALSPDGRSLYAVGYENGTLVTLSRDPATGNLAPAGCLQHQSPTKDEVVDPDDYYEDDEVELIAGCTPARALESASSVTVSADGRSVFTAGGYSMSAFSRDPASGALTQFGCVESDPTYKTCTPGRAIEAASGVAASADGRSLYVTSATTSSVSVFTASVAVTSSVARVSRSRSIRVRLACPRVALRACAGDLRASGTGRRTRFRLAAGASRSVTVRVPRSVRNHRAILVAHAAHTADTRHPIRLT